MLIVIMESKNVISASKIEESFLKESAFIGGKDTIGTVTKEIEEVNALIDFATDKTKIADLKNDLLVSVIKNIVEDSTGLFSLQSISTAKTEKVRSDKSGIYSQFAKLLSYATVAPSDLEQKKKALKDKLDEYQDPKNAGKKEEIIKEFKTLLQNEEVNPEALVKEVITPIAAAKRVNIRKKIVSVLAEKDEKGEFKYLQTAQNSKGEPHVNTENLTLKEDASEEIQALNDEYKKLRARVLDIDNAVKLAYQKRFNENFAAFEKQMVGFVNSFTLYLTNGTDPEGDNAHLIFEQILLNDQFNSKEILAGLPEKFQAANKDNIAAVFESLKDDSERKQFITEVLKLHKSTLSTIDINDQLGKLEPMIMPYIAHFEEVSGAIFDKTPEKLVKLKKDFSEYFEANKDFDKQLSEGNQIKYAVRDYRPINGLEKAKPFSKFGINVNGSSNQIVLTAGRKLEGVKVELDSLSRSTTFIFSDEHYGHADFTGAVIIGLNKRQINGTKNNVGIKNEIINFKNFANIKDDFNDPAFKNRVKELTEKAVSDNQKLPDTENIKKKLANLAVKVEDLKTHAASLKEIESALVKDSKVRRDYNIGIAKKFSNINALKDHALVLLLQHIENRMSSISGHAPYNDAREKLLEFYSDSHSLFAAIIMHHENLSRLGLHKDEQLRELVLSFLAVDGQISADLKTYLTIVQPLPNMKDEAKALLKVGASEVSEGKMELVEEFSALTKMRNWLVGKLPEYFTTTNASKNLNDELKKGNLPELTGAFYGELAYKMGRSDKAKAIMPMFNEMLACNIASTKAEQVSINGAGQIVGIPQESYLDYARKVLNSKNIADSLTEAYQGLPTFKEAASVLFNNVQKYLSYLLDWLFGSVPVVNLITGAWADSNRSYDCLKKAKGNLDDAAKALEGVIDWDFTKTGNFLKNNFNAYAAKFKQEMNELELNEGKRKALQQQFRLDQGNIRKFMFLYNEYLLNTTSQNASRYVANVLQASLLSNIDQFSPEQIAAYNKGQKQIEKSLQDIFLPLQEEFKNDNSNLGQLKKYILESSYANLRLALFAQHTLNSFGFEKQIHKDLRAQFEKVISNEIYRHTQNLKVCTIGKENLLATLNELAKLSEEKNEKIQELIKYVKDIGKANPEIAVKPIIPMQANDMPLKKSDRYNVVGMLRFVEGEFVKDFNKEIEENIFKNKLKYIEIIPEYKGKQARQSSIEENNEEYQRNVGNYHQNLFEAQQRAVEVRKNVFKGIAIGGAIAIGVALLAVGILAGVLGPGAVLGAAAAIGIAVAGPAIAGMVGEAALGIIAGIALLIGHIVMGATIGAGIGANASNIKEVAGTVKDRIVESPAKKVKLEREDAPGSNVSSEEKQPLIAKHGSRSNSIEIS